MSENVKVQRNCEAVMIPSGERMTLRAGTEVTVTQALGGNFTVVSEEGFMLQIDGKDADAIGRKVSLAPDQKGASEEGDVEKLVWNQLKTCYDPEIPVNIVDLGLVYVCQFSSEADGTTVDIKMTLTAPGCGMGDVLRAEVERKVGSVPGVKLVRAELVWQPPWNRDMLSEAAKLQLGMM
jgi:probable FeS assembly SUF system protein SufT